MNREEAKNILDAYIFLRTKMPGDDTNVDPGLTALENVILDSMTNVVVARPWYDVPKPNWVYEPDRVSCRPLAKEHSYSDATTMRKDADKAAHTWLNDMLRKHDVETRNGETQNDGPKRWYDGPEEFGQPADIS